MLQLIRPGCRALALAVMCLVAVIFIYDQSSSWKKSTNQNQLPLGNDNARTLPVIEEVPQDDVEMKDQENSVVDHDPARDFWSWTFEQKSKKKKVEEFCNKHGWNLANTIPAGRILLHKKRKVAYCYIPKAACTTLKILFLHSQGLLPDSYLDYEKRMQPRLAQPLGKILLNSAHKVNYQTLLSDHFKFVMFRHPLERLLSGYRTKMSFAMKKDVPEKGRDIQTGKLLNEKRDLLSHAHPREYGKWEAENESYPLKILFGDFVDYWLRSSNLSGDPHFNTMLRICKPCSVRYDYYGNFKTFEEDAHVVMNRIGASEYELRPQYPDPSGKLINQYYGQLNVSQKIGIVKKLATDLELYYMIFPPEEDTHKQMLGIDIDL